MSRGQILSMMFILGVVTASVLLIFYIITGGLELWASSGIRPDVAGFLQDCAQAASECALVRIGEFGGGIVSPGDSLELISTQTGREMATSAIGCVRGRAHITGDSRGSTSFNAEDTTTMLEVPSGIDRETEEIRFDRFSSAVGVRYAAVRELELQQRKAPGRLEEQDTNLDFLAQVNGRVVVYEY
ncbi:hypothetical protein HY641_00070 [Candidatus Woesearchaeota archaeon]|nr:hypothetical protein [Candidatus Woesearchaeota archaeon]